MSSTKYAAATVHPLAQRVLDALPSMVAYWDRELHCRFANRAYETWFGVDPRRMQGMHLRELLGPELFALNEPFLQAALAGRRQEFERAIPGPDGRVRHSLATYLPDVVDGEVLGIVAHVAEVTGLKQAQAALCAQAEESERARQALNEAQRLGRIGSWQWDAATCRSLWSEDLYRIHGLPPDAPPPPISARGGLLTPDSAARLQEAVTEWMATGEPYSIELEIVRPDGEHRWIEGRGEMVRDAAGRVTGLRGTALDITWRRQVEAARVQLAVAEAASRNKSSLLSRVSHELRTPLNAILGFTELCRLETGGDPRLANWLEHVARSGRHMLRLVDELLDTAAAEAGRLPLSLRDMSLQDVLHDCLMAARPDADSRGLRLVGPAPQAFALRLRADPMRLRQILDNLLSNALKFTPGGGEVRVAAFAEDGGVRVTVADSGPGLTEAQLAGLFEPFNRLGAERLGVPGSGLGLALSRTLAEAMGGGLHIDSAPGQGCVCVLRLPVAGRDPGPVEPPVAA